jgi:hypothetical protein
MWPSRGCTELKNFFLNFLLLFAYTTCTTPWREIETGDYSLPPPLFADFHAFNCIYPYSKCCLSRKRKTNLGKQMVSGKKFTVGIFNTIAKKRKRTDESQLRHYKCFLHVLLVNITSHIFKTLTITVISRYNSSNFRNSFRTLYLTTLTITSFSLSYWLWPCSQDRFRQSFH